MKKIFTFLAIMAGAITVMAQGFNAIPVKVELRDAEGNILANTEVGYKYSLSGAMATPQALLERSGKLTTDDNGILAIRLGIDGTATGSNNVSSLEDFPFDVQAKNGKIPLSLSIDPEGGSNYTISGVTQIGFTVPYSSYSLKSKSTESLGDMPLHNVQIKIENTTGATVTVEFLGKKYTTNSETLLVPAYAPAYISVKLSSYAGKIEYQMLLNGEIVSNLAGTYEKAGSYVNMDFPEASKRSYYYFQVKDKINKYTDSTVEYDNLTLGSGKIADDEENLVGDFVPLEGTQYEEHFKYENPLYVDNTYSGAIKYDSGTNCINGYNPGSFYYRKEYYRTNSPLFVKIPKPTFTNTFASGEIHKVMGSRNTMKADMINQIIGPFNQETNTITIKVSTTFNTIDAVY